MLSKIYILSKISVSIAALVVALAALLGIQMSTLIAMFVLLTADYLLDMWSSKRTLNEYKFKYNTIIYLTKIVSYNLLVGIVFGLSAEFPLVFKAMHTTIICILSLDNLINITNHLSKLTGESIFNELTNMLTNKLIKLKEEKDDKLPEEPKPDAV